MYYEGGFKNNKPDGQGKWVFKNGNTLTGDYEQTKLPQPEDLEIADGDPPPKDKYSITWQSHTQITDAAHKVNSVEQ